MTIDELIDQARQLLRKTLKRALRKEFYYDIDASGEWDVVFRLDWVIAEFAANGRNTVCFIDFIQKTIADAVPFTQAPVVTVDAAAECDFSATINVKAPIASSTVGNPITVTVAEVSPTPIKNIIKIPLI